MSIWVMKFRTYSGLAYAAQRTVERLALLGWLAACIGLPMWLALRY